MSTEERDDEASFWRGVREDAGTDRHNQADRAEWFRVVRARANRIVCRDCHRPIGANCVQLDTDIELTRFPAHVHRINDSERLPL